MNESQFAYCLLIWVLFKNRNTKSWTGTTIYKTLKEVYNNYMAT